MFGKSLHNDVQLLVINRLQKYIEGFLSESWQHKLIVSCIHYHPATAMGKEIQSVQEIQTGNIGQLHVKEEQVGL